MLNELLTLLDSGDAATRQDAIRRLANLRDPAALPHLARVYRTDPDPAIRDLALQAGRYIRRTANADSDPAGGGSGPGSANAADTQGAAMPPPRTLSHKDRQLARSLLDSAIGFAMEDDPGRAVEYLGKALAIDPELRKETYTANLITTLTGLGVNQAMPVLVHPDHREKLIEQLGGKRKLKRVQKHGKGAEKATWDRVAVDFGLYWVFSALAMLALFVIVFTTLQSIFDEYGTSRTYSTTANQVDDIVAASLVALIVLSLISATFNTIGLAINGAAIHFAAVMVFGGDGTLVYLYRRYVSFQTLVIILTTIGAVAIAIPQSPYFMLIMFSLGGVAASVIIVHFTVKIISEVYAFGWWSGCGALIVSGILLAILQCGSQWLLSGVISSLLELGS